MFSIIAVSLFKTKAHAPPLHPSSSLRAPSPGSSVIPWFVLFINANGGFWGQNLPWEKGSGEAKVPPRGFSKGAARCANPRGSSGYLLDPFFFLFSFSSPPCPASHRIKERKSIKSAFSRADNGKDRQAPDRGTAASFVSIKPCTSITLKLNKPPLEGFPPQRLSQPRARYYFNFGKVGVRTSKMNPSLTHTQIFRVSAVSLFRHPSIGKSGGFFWTGCKFLYYFQKSKTTLPPGPAPHRLLHRCREQDTRTHTRTYNPPKLRGAGAMHPFNRSRTRVAPREK